LIADNEIDDASEEIAGDFDALLDIYRAFKHGTDVKSVFQSK